MPELPEVQTTVDGINKKLIGKTIASVWTDYNSRFHAGKENIKNPLFAKTFIQKVAGTTIIKAERRAKIVLIHLNSGHSIITHMKMTGHYILGTWKLKRSVGKTTVEAAPQTPAATDPFNRFIHLLFTFTDGTMLGFSDMRKFGTITLVETKHLDTHHMMRELGPEPLDSTFTSRDLAQQLSKKPKGKIKQVLMDQTIVVGIGNIYSDEALWLANIHPLSIVGKIPKKALPPLLKAIQKTLALGIDFGGDSMSDYRNIDGERGEFQHQHNAYRKTGKPCGKKRCSGIILRSKIGGRSAHYCSKHQILYE